MSSTGQAEPRVEIFGAWLFRHRGSVSAAVLVAVVAATLLVSRVFPATPERARLADRTGVTLLAVSLILRVIVVGTAAPGTSGRNRNRQEAAVLNTTGPYSMVRHPLYAANLIAWIGAGVLAADIWIVLGAVMAGWLLYRPIIASEEGFLRRQFGAAYDPWAACTPMLIPRLAGWERPTGGFNWRAVLRREYPSLVVLSGAAFAVHAARAIGSGARAEPSGEWGWALGFGIVLLVSTGLRVVSRRSPLRESEPPSLPP